MNNSRSEHDFHEMKKILNFALMTTFSDAIIL